MKTRKQYMNNEVSHREYYAQFVTTNLKNKVLNEFGIKAIKAHVASELFEPNYIELKRWDSMTAPYGTINLMAEAGDSLTMAGQVCIAKEAAQQLAEA
jgi:hypothetical protein